MDLMLRMFIPIFGSRNDGVLDSGFFCQRYYISLIQRCLCGSSDQEAELLAKTS